jgi:4'-phosphopantetheinyl transferase
MVARYFLAAPPAEVTLADAPRWLDAAELARMARYRFDPSKLEFLVGRWLIKTMLRAHHGVAEPRLTCVIHEKPRLVDGGPSFSLSHSGGAFALIVADREVGIDVEPLRPVGSDLVEIALGDQERTRVDGELAFFRVWTAKEAYMKRSGEGLGIEPRRLTVDLARNALFDSATSAWHPFEWERRDRFVVSWL